jgi:hypothetical protein
VQTCDKKLRHWVLLNISIKTALKTQERDKIRLVHTKIQNLILKEKVDKFKLSNRRQKPKNSHLPSPFSKIKRLIIDNEILHFKRLTTKTSIFLQ